MPDPWVRDWLITPEAAPLLGLSGSSPRTFLRCARALGVRGRRFAGDGYKGVRWSRSDLAAAVARLEHEERARHLPGPGPGDTMRGVP